MLMRDTNIYTATREVDALESNASERAKDRMAGLIEMIDCAFDRRYISPTLREIRIGPFEGTLAGQWVLDKRDIDDVYLSLHVSVESKGVMEDDLYDGISIFFFGQYDEKDGDRVSTTIMRKRCFMQGVKMDVDRLLDWQENIKLGKENV